MAHGYAKMAHMAREEIVSILGPFVELERTLKSGKTKRRLRVEIESTPIVHDFSDRALGALPAKAIAEHLQEELSKATGGISESTKDARKKAAKAFASGKGWAKRRYAGGRIGSTPPDQANMDRPGVFSGRLRDSIVAAEHRDNASWIVNVAANRLSRATARTEGEYQALLKSIAIMMPSLRNPQALARSPKVREAVEKSIHMLIAVAKDRQDELKTRRDLAALQLLGMGSGPIGTILSAVVSSSRTHGTLR